MPTYKAELSTASLTSLLNKVESYAKKVRDLPQNIVKAVATEIEYKILERLTSITDQDGNALGEVSVEISGSSAVVAHEGKQIAYLEYGTGYKGLTSPHPLADDASWEYGSGSKIIKTKSGKMMWRYYDNIRHKWRYTEGLPAQKQVYDAAQYVRDNIAVIAKGALNDTNYKRIDNVVEQRVV